MRSSRHIALLLNLQARGGASAHELAEDLGVSIRTIYRDVEQLSEAGVPIYAERGNGGGIRLVDGYRTQLTGLDLAETEALSLAGWAPVAEALGVGSAAAGAERKLLAALPRAAASKARRIRGRIHFDLARWYDATSTPDTLPALARAVWDERRLRIDYTSWTGRSKRDVDPFGLVLKNAAWYLVARHDGDLRTYRVSEIQGIEPCAGAFDIPDDFDLPRFWEASSARFEASLPRINARIRTCGAPSALPARLAARAHVESRDARGRTTFSISIESIDGAAREFLALGDLLEVLEPPELRERIADAVRATAALYT